MSELPEGDLVALAEAMREPGPPSGWNGVAQDFDNEAIPAGYTYLGQFIDHDITFDPASLSERRDDPDALHSFRSPRFDLDSVYGSGPVDEPFQYATATDPRRLLIGMSQAGDPDLPRNTEGTALIGDPRNDENIIVSQLQLLFLKLHNKIAGLVGSDGVTPQDRWFDETQQRVRWLYQWVVVHDYLPRIVGQDLVDDLLIHESDTGVFDVRRRFYLPKRNAYMPLEFSGAAFRFGHSMIRGIYNLSGQVTDRPIFTPADPAGEFDDLRGFRPLPPGWTIDWSLFFPIAGSTPQPSRHIDAKLVTPLFDLPGQVERPAEESLAFRNLLRGQLLRLPSGQDVARFMGHVPLTGAELQAPEPTPLWFYILKEAELQTGGQRLGKVGGRIVAEVLLGMLELDKRSWINQSPEWTPTAIVADTDGDGVIRMSDVIAFVAAN